ncbi:MAG: (d)CMP kinase [Oscillospiraceae bacterium]|nr:(d)CMP kinase [Oscillospiraceae bacterium]
MKTYNIAIDGPSGAGKSTISRTVAEKLGFLYVDTGAMYRVIGLHYLETGSPSLDGLTISLKYVNGEQRVLMNDRDVSEEIRQHSVSRAASDRSKEQQVRDFLLEQQRHMAKKHNVIMDGRDIGTVVLPGADLKIFLTADPEERARRRYDELLLRGEKTFDYETILHDITERDRQDQDRSIAPLKPAQDAIILNTTGNTFEQSVLQIEKLIRKHTGI